MATQSTWRSPGTQASAAAASKWEANANPSGIRSATTVQQHTNVSYKAQTQSAENGGTAASTTQRRTSATPYASALGSKQQATAATANTAATTDNDARGVQSDRMTYLLVGLIGNTVLATTRSGARFVGILSATSVPESGTKGSLGIVLSCAQQVMPDSESLGALKKTFIIKGDDLDAITAHEVGLDVPVSLSKGDRNVNAAFGIDTDISAKALSGDVTGGRTLEKWTGGADTEMLLDESSSGGGGGGGAVKDSKSGAWDQFAANEAKFGVKSNYDETMYTTKLDKSGADFHERQRKADQLAREIMNSATTNTHIAEERSAEALADNAAAVGQSEEDKYGAVVRGSGAYVPPAARRAAAAAAAANANVSATARMNNAAADSASPSASNTPSIVTTAPTAAGGANDQKSAQHQDAVVDFRQFVSQERERAEKKKAALAKKEKESTLTDLKSWSSTFKLSFAGQTKPNDGTADKGQVTQDVASSKDTSAGGAKDVNGTPTASRPKPTEPSNAAAQLAKTKAMLASWKVPEIPSLDATKKKASAATETQTPAAVTVANAAPTSVTPSTSLMSLAHIPPYKKNRARDPSATASTSTTVAAAPTATADAKAAAASTSSSKSAFRMSAKASSFKPFNPNATAFTPGTSTNVSSRVSVEASSGLTSPAPAATPPHPFFGHRVVKKVTTADKKQTGLREDFNPFKTGKVSDAATVDSSWGFTGKPYRALFHAIPPNEDNNNAGFDGQAPHVAPNAGLVPGMQGVPPQGMMAGQSPYQHQHGPHLVGVQGMGGGGGGGNVGMGGAGAQMFYMPYGGGYRFPGAGGGGAGQQAMQSMGPSPYMAQPPYMAQMPFSPPMPPSGPPPHGASMYSPQMQNMMPAGVGPPNMAGGGGAAGRGPSHGKGMPPNMYYQAANAQPMPFISGAGGPPSFHHASAAASAGPSPLIRHQQQHGHHAVNSHHVPMANVTGPHGIATPPPAPGSQGGASSTAATPSIASANLNVASSATPPQPPSGSNTTSPPNGKA